jgi:hypothetical protein
MADLPNPFLLGSAEPALSGHVVSIFNRRWEREIAADSAAGPGLTDPPVPAVGYFVSSPEFSDISHVNEIFHYARKLCGDNRFVLDQAAFMAAIEEPLPIFLR